MTRELTAKEYAVFDAIKNQRVNSVEPAFVYVFSEGQKYLNKINASFEHAIEINDQFETIKTLAEDGILKADWIIEKDTEYKINGVGYGLANDEDWAQKLFERDFFFMIKYNHDEICFININSADIKAIEKSRKKYPARLSFDKKNFIFTIRCNNEEYTIQCFWSCSRPYEIISYAMMPDNLGRDISKEELNKHLGECKIPYDTIGEKESIRSKVFEKNPKIKNTLSPFIKLDINSIRIDPEVSLTQEQLNAIKKAS